MTKKKATPKVENVRAQRRREYQENLKLLKEEKPLWSAFTKFRSELESLDGDRKVAAMVFSRLTRAAARPGKRERLLKIIAKKQEELAAL